ncbi:hypothetical protein QBC47DRAFT_459025 [Echria macrotheca]|uniref:Uncharacterized protein n=1 Tax=Echria macrotheca TaxID=438768 RepID=A0AAJ0BFV5_9PEZI|nr:hypothetical protein QBC47DRAFT_459025 [Echria macrotheca]
MAALLKGMAVKGHLSTPLIGRQDADLDLDSPFSLGRALDIADQEGEPACQERKKDLIICSPPDTGNDGWTPAISQSRHLVRTIPYDIQTEGETMQGQLLWFGKPHASGRWLSADQLLLKQFRSRLHDKDNGYQQLEDSRFARNQAASRFGSRQEGGGGERRAVHVGDACNALITRRLDALALTAATQSQFACDFAASHSYGLVRRIRSGASNGAPLCRTR